MPKSFNRVGEKLKTYIMRKLMLTIFGLLIFFSLFAQEIPLKISYQGKLFESGVPVTGTKNIIFTIGSWTETHINVSVNDGLYSVILGETNSIPTNIFDNTSSVYLEVSVEGSTLTPQTEILSVPYAYKSEKAVDAGKIAGNAVSTTSPSSGQVLKWNGSQWAPQTDSLGGLTLPYSSIYSGSAINTFAIENGTSATGNNILWVNNMSNTGRAAYFNISSTSNSSDVLKIYNDGTGRGINISQESSNSNYGIDIGSWSNIKEGLYIDMSGSAGAAYFNGNVEISGTISKSSGTFKIDHPLDPENKYLYHSFVESPDMMNVYNGNIITDADGVAVIQLPNYFDALNKDFRYQLTVIGVFCQAIIYKKISNNQFTIKTDKPNVEVSWQVTGIRKDPYANAHRVQPVVEKSAKEKGHYLHYKEYNQPIEKSIRAVKDPEILNKNGGK